MRQFPSGSMKGTHVTVSLNAIPVTIVSRDRKMLRDLSWTLSNFGYRVTASVDWSETAPWRRANEPELWLLDSRDEEATAALQDRPSKPFSYRISIGGESDLLSQGADDVLRHPINIGELLTRLRSGVRRLEFERRLKQRDLRDRSANLLTQRGLVEKMQQIASESDPTTHHGLVVLGIDAIDKVRETHGASGLRKAAAPLARKLAGSTSETVFCGELGEGVYGALLVGKNADQTVQFAEKVSAAYSASETLSRELTHCPTISAATALWDTKEPAGEALASVSGALDQVRSYGGACVLDYHEIQQELATWRRDTDAGTFFQNVVARDLMEPLPMAIASGSVVSIDLGQSSDTKRSLPPCVPVVDAERRLLGVIDPADLPCLGEGPVAEHLIQPTESTVEHDLPLNDLFEAFSSAAVDYLLVLNQQRPVGYMTSEGLASLVVDPIDASTYFRQTSAEEGLAGLVVPVEPEQRKAESEQSVGV